MSEACGVGPERSAENSLAGPWGCLAHGHVLATVSRTICSKIQKPPSAPHSGPLARALLPAGFALLADPSAASRICRAWRLESSFSGYSRSCVKAPIPSLSSVMWKLRPALGDVQRGEHPGDCGRGHFSAPTDQGGGEGDAVAPAAESQVRSRDPGISHAGRVPRGLARPRAPERTTAATGCPLGLGTGQCQARSGQTRPCSGWVSAPRRRGGLRKHGPEHALPFPQPKPEML